MDMKCRFIETLCVDGGRALHLDCHARRMARTLSAHGLTPSAVSAAVSRFRLMAVTEASARSIGLFRATFTYGLDGLLVPKFVPYIRPVLSRLRLFAADGVDYRYKYADRSALDLFASQCAAGEVALLTVGGLLTDTTFTNIVCEDAHGLLLTPARPLLEGTALRRLIDSGAVHPADITPSDLPRFVRLHLINAMNPLGSLTILPTVC